MGESGTAPPNPASQSRGMTQAQEQYTMALALILIQAAEGGAWITVHARLHVAQGTLHKRARKDLEEWLIDSLQPHIGGATNAAILAACREAAKQAGCYKTFGRHPLVVFIHIERVVPIVEFSANNYRSVPLHRWTEKQGRVLHPVYAATRYA